MKVLGIDPGLQKTGWAVIEKTGYDISYIKCGVVRTSPNESIDERLIKIFNFIQDICQYYCVDKACIEEVFLNSYPKSSEKLIMARTSSILALAKCEVPIQTFCPNEVKKNVTGSGHSSKLTVETMVQKILNIKIEKSREITHDSIDALAIAICGVFAS